ncbi:Plasmodium exported protein, unknown function [Plasmodium vivax]|uniref:Uncharacterized protein n=1 Tax=Plasmodium vivax TaxID=5855 RepID=A0A565A4L0_PLAVI|nr:Plasmodium exported protein, unknown function [Plasmodium vivax]
MKEYKNVLSVFKVAASILFIWIHNPYNDMYNFVNNLENLYNVEMTSHTRLQRLLAKHEPKKELGHSSVRNKLLENNAYENAQYTSGDLSKYAQLKKKGLNDLDLYKKLYKQRYSKSNVLGKFDCYCEKKVFDKFDYIHELKEKLQHDKRSFNKKLDKMLTIRFIIFGLVPLIGFIIPLLKNDYFEIIPGCFQGCDIESHLQETGTPKPHKDGYTFLSIDKNTWNLITYVDLAFSCIATVIVLFVVLYILLKMLKYKKLKAGKDKMRLKEYFHFFNTPL